MKIFKPGMVLDSFKDLDAPSLYQKGIRLLICDIDNTLVPHNFPDPTQAVRDFFDTLNKNCINICFMTNNSADRAEVFNKDLGFKIIANAKKPCKKAYIETMNMFGVNKTQTAAIGDQIFTDIWGGNRAGVLTILVKPVEVGGEGWFIAFKRKLEKLFI